MLRILDPEIKDDSPDLPWHCVFCLLQTNISLWDWRAYVVICRPRQRVGLVLISLFITLLVKCLLYLFIVYYVYLNCSAEMLLLQLRALCKEMICQLVCWLFSECAVSVLVHFSKISLYVRVSRLADVLTWPKWGTLQAEEYRNDQIFWSFMV